MATVGTKEESLQLMDNVTECITRLELAALPLKLSTAPFVCMCVSKCVFYL